jgi:hypothetical protein
LELLTLSAKLRHRQTKGRLSDALLWVWSEIPSFWSCRRLGGWEFIHTSFMQDNMKKNSKSIQQTEEDLYRELLAVADDDSYMKATDSKLYYSTVIADMTSVANMAKKSDVIRQFFIDIDKNPDMALDEMLKRAIAEIERMKECH